MATRLVNPRDLAFVLYELWDVERLCAWPRFGEHSRATFDAALETAARLAASHFANHNRRADLDEPRVVDGRVVLVPEVKWALDAFAEAGFPAAHRDEAEGGMQLPWVVAQACMAHFQAANIATSAYPFLTIAAANLLEAFGSREQRARWLPPLLDGRFFGTMVLSEPAVGSSLGDITTTAEPLGDGRYALRGTKMWISGGEHELADNIVHLVLARIAGAPAGPKGLSLFLVPRYRLDDDGRPGAVNDVTLVGLNHKMGYRGTVNTVLSFGDRGDCRAELIGAPGQGLAIMFHMMNEARIGVGMGAIMLGYAGFLHSLAYARDRRQGRLPDDKAAEEPVAIVAHADVKRMLLAQKAIVEGGLALGLLCARLVDQQRHDPAPNEAERASRLLDLLTPVIKAWGSDQALRANELAIQILGGYGYTRDHPVEQHYRDNRLNPIHEGTNGIQALDLLGRKAIGSGRAALDAWLTVARSTADAATDQAELAAFAAQLHAALERVATTTETLRQAHAEQGPAVALANATAYLDLLGHTVNAWIWLHQAAVAARALAHATGADQGFYRGKLATCRYVFGHELPKTEPLATLLKAVDRTSLDTNPDWL